MGLRAGVVGLALAAAAAPACETSKGTETPARPRPVDAPVATLATGARDAAIEVTPPPKPAADAVDQVVFTADGTLVAATRRVLIARSPSGVVKKTPLSADASVHASALFSGVALEDNGAVKLLATPGLEVLLDEKGTAMSFAAGAVSLAANAVALQHGDRALRLALPPSKGDAPGADNVVVVAGGKRVDVTVGDASATQSAILFDADTGKRLGRGVPLASTPVQTPRGGWVGDAGFFFDGARLTRVDLMTAAVKAQATVRCGKDQEIGNPTPSPSADLVLVTCGFDGVVLDGNTLAEKRRIPSIMPGCDNGMILSGAIQKDGHTLRVEGCGGEARLDLTTGIYACGDDSGLLGAPYDMGLAPPVPVATSTAPVAPAAAGRRAPAGREHVKRCSPEDASPPSPFGRSGRYTLAARERLSVESSAAKIELEENSGYPVIAPDEATFAYARGGDVVVRALPDGKILATIGAAP